MRSTLVPVGAKTLIARLGVQSRIPYFRGQFGVDVGQSHKTCAPVLADTGRVTDSAYGRAYVDHDIHRTLKRLPLLARALELFHFPAQVRGTNVCLMHVFDLCMGLIGKRVQRFSRVIQRLDMKGEVHTILARRLCDLIAQLVYKAGHNFSGI